MTDEGDRATGAEFRVLLGMASGCLWGIGASQWFKAVVEHEPVLLWIMLTVAGGLGVALTARYARNRGWRRRNR